MKKATIFREAAKLLADKHRFYACVAITDIEGYGDDAEWGDAAVSFQYLYSVGEEGLNDFGSVHNQANQEHRILALLFAAEYYS